MALFGRNSQRDEQRAMRYRQWTRRQHPLALASAVLGIISFIEFGVLIVFGLAGIALGIIALRQPAGEQGEGEDRRLALVGISLSVVSLGVAAFLYARRGG